MRATLAALVAGIVFGAGLALSDMVNPARVLGFLDVAGIWDATLALVMAGAVAVSAIGYVGARRLRAPPFGTRFFIPENRRLDGRLLGGAALFGIGWGLAGLCPGPAVAGLIYGMWQSWVFVAAMLTGMVLERVVPGLRLRGVATAGAAESRPR
jgi:uncharacterized membrane protein YedE/YeeE